MKKYKLSLDELIQNSMQVHTLITVEADTLVGLLSKFLLAITAVEERVIEKMKEREGINIAFIQTDDDIPF